MIGSAPVPAASGALVRPGSEDRISFVRLAWVAPLTPAVALGAAYAVRFVVELLQPRLARMPQLGSPMLALTIEGVVAAVVVFGLMALLVPRAIFWYRIVGIVALAVSLLPDIALALGGAPMRLSMTVMSPLASVGMPEPSGPPPGGFPGGGGPPGGFAGGPPPGGGNFTTPIEQVLVLMLLHVVIAAVCIVLLTTLTRTRTRTAIQAAPQG